MKKILLFLIGFFIFQVSNAQTLPDMTLNDIYGNRVNVKHYADSGQIVVMSFWATWCSPCKKELKNINAILEDWEADYGMKLVSINTDNARNTMKVKPFADGQNWGFDVILDTNQDLQRALNAPSIPYTLLIDKSGKIVYTHTGYLEGDEYELEDKIKALAEGKEIKH